MDLQQYRACIDAPQAKNQQLPRNRIRWHSDSTELKPGKCHSSSCSAIIALCSFFFGGKYRFRLWQIRFLSRSFYSRAHCYVLYHVHAHSPRGTADPCLRAGGSSEPPEPPQPTGLFLECYHFKPRWCSHLQALSRPIFQGKPGSSEELERKVSFTHIQMSIEVVLLHVHFPNCFLVHFFIPLQHTTMLVSSMFQFWHNSIIPDICITPLVHSSFIIVSF